jgi:hypothetical protein
MAAAIPLSEQRSSSIPNKTISEGRGSKAIVRLCFPEHDARNSQTSLKETAMLSLRSGLTAVFACVVFAHAAFAAPAKPTCQKMAFSVNDYGKDGPTRDAQDLLEKHIADWAKTQGIKKYKVGKKDVSCELFLDVVLFDEHTCKATADVCWTK